MFFLLVAFNEISAYIGNWFTGQVCNCSIKSGTRAICSARTWLGTSSPTQTRGQFHYQFRIANNR